jgi:hypothetical protein
MNRLTNFHSVDDKKTSPDTFCFMQVERKRCLIRAGCAKVAKSIITILLLKSGILD